MYPVLQVALDLEELVRAVDIASKLALATKCDHLWIEVGTPLIKAWGKLAIRALKELTNCYLVADTKTVDVPRLEAKLVSEAGANAFTVLALSDEDVLKEAAEARDQYGVKLVVDLIGCKDPYRRALELAKYEPDVLVFHIGISAQRARGIEASALVDEAERVKRELGVRVGVAGGLKPGMIGPIVSRNVDVIIVGSAITYSANPVEVAMNVLREMGYLRS